MAKRTSSKQKARGRKPAAKKQAKAKPKKQAKPAKKAAAKKATKPAAKKAAKPAAKAAKKAAKPAAKTAKTAKPAAARAKPPEAVWSDDAGAAVRSPDDASVLDGVEGHGEGNPSGSVEGGEDSHPRDSVETGNSEAGGVEGTATDADDFSVGQTVG